MPGGGLVHVVCRIEGQLHYDEGGCGHGIQNREGHIGGNEGPGR